MITRTTRARRWLGRAVVTLALVAAAQATGGRAVAQQTEPVHLYFGCNSVALTWPSGTPPRTVAAALTPSAALVVIWRFDNRTKRFQGFSAAYTRANDLARVQQLDSAFICVDRPATLTRPMMVLRGR